MSSRLKKMLTISSSIVMALSVGTGISNMSASAKRKRPIHSVRIIKRHKHSRYASKEGASLARKFIANDKIASHYSSIKYTSLSKKEKHLYNKAIDSNKLEKTFVNNLIKNHINKSFLSSFYHTLKKDGHEVKNTDDFGPKLDKEVTKSYVKQIRTYFAIHNLKARDAYYDLKLKFSIIPFNYKLRNNRSYKNEWIKVNNHDAQNRSKRDTLKVYNYYIRYGRAKAKHNNEFLKGWNAAEKVLKNNDPYSFDGTDDSAKPHSNNSQYKSGWQARGQSALLSISNPD